MKAHIITYLQLDCGECRESMLQHYDGISAEAFYHCINPDCKEYKVLYEAPRIELKRADAVHPSEEQCHA